VGVAGAKAMVITVSDGVSSGHREDKSGAALESLLAESGFSVDRAIVADEFDQIAEVIRSAARTTNLVVTTGGTGFGPRDVTPEATASVLEREAPGLAQLMISSGLESTRMAALSRLRVGAIGPALVVNVPGSPKGAVESLEAILDLIPHALELLAGNTRH